jgi:uncharacterized membrane protein
MIKSLMSILILTLCLSHCALSTTDIAVGVGGGMFTAIKDKPNPFTAIKFFRKDKDDR